MRILGIAPIKAQTEALRAPMVGRAGQTAARTEELYRFYGERVRRWVQRLGGTRLDVEEAVQEVLRCPPKPRRFRWNEHTHLALPDHRTRGLQQAAPRALAPLAGPRSNAGRETGRSSLSERSALERIDQARASALVYRVLDTMSERHRSILVLFALEGMNGEQIAELKGIRVGTVWVWLHRARNEFVKQLRRLQLRERKVRQTHDQKKALRRWLAEAQGRPPETPYRTRTSWRAFY